MKVFLIRHGESESDVEDRYGGDYDDHLTDKGKKQAEKAVKQLINRKVELIFSSPRFRAKETAKILSNELKCKVEVANNLRERNRYGVLTGMKRTGAIKKHPELVQLLKDERNTIEGAEEYDHFVERVVSAFNKIKKENERIDAKGVNAHSIVIVSHGGPIKCIMNFLGKPINKKLKDCEIIKLEI